MKQLGNELLAQVEGQIDVFCGAVGTAGMLMGTARALKGANPATRVVAFEPGTSPLITQGTAGTHHVEGIGTSFIPPLLDQAATTRRGRLTKAKRA